MTRQEVEAHLVKIGFVETARVGVIDRWEYAGYERGEVSVTTYDYELSLSFVTDPNIDWFKLKNLYQVYWANYSDIRIGKRGKLLGLKQQQKGEK